MVGEFQLMFLPNIEYALVYFILEKLEEKRVSEVEENREKEKDAWQAVEIF